MLLAKIIQYIRIHYPSAVLDPYWSWWWEKEAIGECVWAIWRHFFCLGFQFFFANWNTTWMNKLISFNSKRFSFVFSIYLLEIIFFFVSFLLLFLMNKSKWIWLKKLISIPPFSVGSHLRFFSVGNMIEPKIDRWMYGWMKQNIPALEID